VFSKKNDILGADMRNSYFNNWMSYAFGEAIGRTIGKIIQKVIGALGNTFGHTLFVVSIVGLVQIVLACLAWRKNRFSFFPNRKYILGSLSFGFLAFVTMALGFTVFQLGGSISVNTFFVTLSIIPGALIDHFFFGHRLNMRQWFAIGVGVIAGYAILDFPSLFEIVGLPLWVLLSLGMTFTLAINQGITKIIQNVNPWVQNFWGGMITLVCALASFVLIPPGFLFSDPLTLIMLLSSLAIISGILVVIVWMFNLYGYRYGAAIAIKKLTVHGSFFNSCNAIWRFVVRRNSQAFTCAECFSLFLRLSFA